MTFVADECVDKAIVERLRAEGHNVEFVAELEPGISDEEVLRLAADRGAPLITADRDFGELVYRRRMLHAGVILIRLAGLSSAEKATRTSDALREHLLEVPHAFTVISPNSVRVRKPLS